jgi:hypothetical protein
MKYKSKEYTDWLHKQPCIICGETPCDGHHVLHGTDKRNYDFAQVPVDRPCHTDEKLQALGDDVLLRLAFIHIWRFFNERG